MQVEKDFIDFLRSKECLEDFAKEVGYDKDINIYVFNQLENGNPAYLLICNAFTWSNSERGYSFWANVDEDWAQYCADNYSYIG